MPEFGILLSKQQPANDDAVNVPATAKPVVGSAPRETCEGLGCDFLGMTTTPFPFLAKEEGRILLDV